MRRRAAIFLLAWSGLAWAQPEDPPKTQEPEPRFSWVDVTPGIYGKLPYLRPGFRFFSLYPGQNPGHGEVHSLYAQNSEGHIVKLTRTQDLFPLVEKITTEEEALRYVRFLSDHGLGGNVSHDYFSDVPFWELNRQMGPVTVPEKVWERHRILPAVPWERTDPQGGKEFLIERFVFLEDQMERLFSAFQAGVSPLTLSEIGRVKEVVTPKGEYRFELTRIPVEGFEVEFHPAGLD